MILVSLVMNTRARLLVLGALLATSFASPTAAQSNEQRLKENLERAKKVVDGGAKSPENNPHYASGYWSIGEDYYRGISTKEEMQARVAKMHENRNERRKEHLNGLLLKWGARVLARPGAREELQIHARREAYTARALFLAHTEPSVKNRAELIARLEDLIEYEAGRNADALRALGSAPPAASNSGPPAPAPATSTGAGSK